ncbi:MAG: U32 family peptidase [Rhodospirillaceae bacterium]
MTRDVRLTLGPLLYNWPTSQRLEFYGAIAADTSYDAVVLGEVVCVKRSPFLSDTILEVAQMLEMAGKEVIFSTLALPVTPRERAELADVCAMADDGIMVEANEAGALYLLDGRPHRVGPYFNIYNAETLRVLAGRGATTVCLPWELDRPAVEALSQAGTAEGLTIEVPAFGSIPLAISARCAHARAHGLAKDGCQYVCGQDSEGMPVDTIDGQTFLRLNGTQTLSDAVLVLATEIPALVRAGVAALRITPEGVDMVAVGRIYRALLDGRVDSSVAEAMLRDLLGKRRAANGYLHGRAGAAWKTMNATS